MKKYLGFSESLAPMVQKTNSVRILWIEIKIETI